MYSFFLKAKSLIRGFIADDALQIGCTVKFVPVFCLYSLECGKASFAQVDENGRNVRISHNTYTLVYVHIFRPIFLLT